MKRYTRRMVCGIAVAVLAAMAANPLAADDAVCRPFEILVDSSEFIELPGNCFLVLQTGQATHMGEIESVTEVCVFGKRAVGERTVSAANGDQLFILNETELNPETGRFEGIFTILGGTGRFAGASGGGVQIPGVITAGTICY